MYFSFDGSKKLLYPFHVEMCLIMLATNTKETERNLEPGGGVLTWSRLIFSVSGSVNCVLFSFQLVRCPSACRFAGEYRERRYECFCFCFDLIFLPRSGIVDLFEYTQLYDK